MLSRRMKVKRSLLPNRNVIATACTYKGVKLQRFEDLIDNGNLRTRGEWRGHDFGADG
jgi:hypothetical protein